MRKVVALVVVTVLVLGIGGLALAHGFGPYGRASGAHGPMGGFMMGPGMMGQGTGPMGQYGSHPCWEASGITSSPQAKALTKDEATILLQGYIVRLRNPNLKLGTITETDTAFEAEVLTKDNSLVEKVLLDKRTGWLRRAL